MSMLSLFAVATDSRVDAENGVLSGIRVITKGEAKGHNFMGEPIIIDDTTLDEVVSASATFADGVPVKLAHGTDIEELVGSIRNIVKDGDCVRGDLYLLKSHENYATIIEMAETMPSNFGISISFQNAPEAVYGNDQEPDGDEDDEDVAQGINPQYADQVGGDIVAYAARVCELYSADLVQAPACNPSLFSEIMSEPNATPEVLAEAPVEEVKVEETAPAAEAPAESVVAIEVKVELNAVTESEPSKEESPAVEIVKEKKESSEEPAVKSEEIPAVAELSRTWGAVTTDLEATRTELSRVQSDLAAARTEIESFKSELSKRDAELVDLRYLHRSVLSVMGLSASIEIPEIVEEAPAMSVIEKYESMPAGAERLSFFQANRREIERSIAARLK
jgi:hypothetical protein